MTIKATLLALGLGVGTLSGVATIAHNNTMVSAHTLVVHARAATGQETKDTSGTDTDASAPCTTTAGEQTGNCQDSGSAAEQADAATAHAADPVDAPDTSTASVSAAAATAVPDGADAADAADKSGATDTADAADSTDSSNATDAADSAGQTDAVDATDQPDATTPATTPSKVAIR